MAETKEKKYVSDNAQLMAEWDWEKNDEAGLDPRCLGISSGKKAWWICAICRHEWQTRVSHRSDNHGCPRCARKKALESSAKARLQKNRSLADTHPLLIIEWNHEKNGELTPTEVLPNSNKKVWWKCSKGHEWQATINHRSNGRKCPYCSGHKVLKGYNDLQTINPNVSKEWNFEKNRDLMPTDITPNSDKKVWWKCKKGHEWQTTVGSRNRGTGCPYCAGQKIIHGSNDLETLNPSLAKEWNYEKNFELVPTNTMSNSSKKVWWKCEEGHEWQATVSNRNKGAGCPYCAGQKVIKGHNDLQTINPILADEWHWQKNNELTPTDVMPNSAKKVWWLCRKGHEWQATISSRNNGIGCPICDSERKTSFPEYALVYYLEKYGFDVLHSYRENGYELDVYIPSKRIGIEYDGFFWHKDRAQKDITKNEKCQKDGITLYRIRENLPLLHHTSIDYVVQNDRRNLSNIIGVILGKILLIKVDIDLERDFIAIENLREHKEKENSLSFTNPEIAREWNHERNGTLKPEHISANSAKKIWWICDKGHEWQTTISHRTTGNNCPYCSNKKVLKGYNDLQTSNPILVKEWNFERNAVLTPGDVTPGSGKKVWWICSRGHEWRMPIRERNKGRGCPYCSGRKKLQ